MPVGVSAGSCHSAFCQLVPPRCHTSSSHTSSPVTHRKSMCLRHSEAKRWEFGAEKGLLQGHVTRCVYIFFFFFGCTPSMQKFPGI